MSHEWRNLYDSLNYEEEFNQGERFTVSHVLLYQGRSINSTFNSIIFIIYQLECNIRTFEIPKNVCVGG